MNNFFNFENKYENGNIRCRNTQCPNDETLNPICELYDVLDFKKL